MSSILLGVCGLALMLLAAIWAIERFGLPAVMGALVGVIIAGHWLGI